MSVMDTFSLELLDANTQAVLPQTVIAGVSYVQVEYGQEFHIRTTVKNAYKHKIMYPSGDLNARISLEGNKLNYSKSYYNDVSSVVFDNTGGRSLVITKPELVFFFDIEDKKKADREAALAQQGESKVGLIEATFTQCIRTGSVVASSGGSIQQEKMKKKAGTNAAPVAGIGAGRALQQYNTGPRTLKSIQTVHTHGSLRVYVKPKQAIDMMRCAAEGRPYVFDDVPERDEAEEEEVQVLKVHTHIWHTLSHTHKNQYN